MTESHTAFVVPRYGIDIVGGAETLCRMLAENLTANGRQVDVLTTCATDHFTWRNELPEGDSHINGVRVRRFAVGPRDDELFGVLHARIARGHALSYFDQARWMTNSVWSPGLLSAAASYRRLIALPYLFGTTFWTVVAFPDRTIVLPCLHDEPHAHQPLILDALSSCLGVMLNAEGEGTLLHRLLRNHRGGSSTRMPMHVVGGGFEEERRPHDAEIKRFLRGHDAEAGYFLYAGRREQGKGLRNLFALYRTYRDSSDNPRPLALMGTGAVEPPRELRRSIIDFGYVSPRERTLVYAGATALLHPSRLESFGLVLFEAWLMGVPALVNGQSDVLRQHCELSGGGLWYRSPDMFVEAAKLLSSDLAENRRLGNAGRAYALSQYSWEAVRRRFSEAMWAWQ